MLEIRPGTQHLLGFRHMISTSLFQTRPVSIIVATSFLQKVASVWDNLWAPPRPQLNERRSRTRNDAQTILGGLRTVCDVEWHVSAPPSHPLPHPSSRVKKAKGRPRRSLPLALPFSSLCSAHQNHCLLLSLLLHFSVLHS